MWHCVQGVTELTKPCRCSDDWWNSVLDEIRATDFSGDSHDFLHGVEASVPGNWVRNGLERPNSNCAGLPAK